MVSRTSWGLLLLLVASCGEGSGPSMFALADSSGPEGGRPSSAANGGATSDSSTVAWNGGTANPDEAVIGEGVSMPGTTKHGVVSLAQVDATDLPATPTANAAFQEAPATWAGCTRYDVGVCYFYECGADANSVHSIMNSGFAAASAGALTLSGGGSVRAFEQDASGLYSLTADSLWAVPGAEIVVDATGGDVPAFEVTLTAPEAVVLTSPNVDPLEPLNWTRTAHLPLAWTPASAGLLRVGIYDTEFDRARPALYCTFPAQAGEGVIPAAALSAMEPGGPYMFRFSVLAESTVTAGDWSITVSAAAYSNDRAGEIDSMFWLVE